MQLFPAGPGSVVPPQVCTSTSWNNDKGTVNTKYKQQQALEILNHFSTHESDILDLSGCEYSWGPQYVLVPLEGSVGSNYNKHQQEAQFQPEPICYSEAAGNIIKLSSSQGQLIRSTEL